MRVVQACLQGAEVLRSAMPQQKGERPDVEDPLEASELPLQHTITPLEEAASAVRNPTILSPSCLLCVNHCTWR